MQLLPVVALAPRAVSFGIGKLRCCVGLAVYPDVAEENSKCHSGTSDILQQSK